MSPLKTWCIWKNDNQGSLKPAFTKSLRCIKSVINLGTISSIFEVCYLIFWKYSTTCYMNIQIHTEVNIWYFIKVLVDRFYNAKQRTVVR